MFDFKFCCMKSEMSLIVILMVICVANGTIDLNLGELQFVADHLTPLECRRLVAALHFKSFNVPNSLDQAERKVPTDESCVNLLLHWNSAEGEGRGESHELLVHRLKQIGKDQLADYVGKTVFRRLGKDLQRDVNAGFDDILQTSQVSHEVEVPTLQPVVKSEDPSQYNALDTILYVVAAGLLAVSVALCARIAYVKICRRNKGKISKNDKYKQIESDTESEDHFDVRDHIESQKKLIDEEQ